MNIFVGSASRNTNIKAYNKIALDIAKYIVDGNHTYVFGGCNNGLMGRIYTYVSQHNCDIVASGVECYKDEIVYLREKDENVKATIADTVNERKNNVIKASDVLIFIPGGLGTLDELFACIETRRAGEHNKPIYIVNTNGYYNYLLDMLNKIYAEGFASEENRKEYKICESFEELKAELDLIAKNN